MDIYNQMPKISNHAVKGCSEKENKSKYKNSVEIEKENIECCANESSMKNVHEKLEIHNDCRISEEITEIEGDIPVD